MSLMPPCIECEIPTWAQHSGPAPVGTRQRSARGLCGACFARAKRDGRVDDFELRNRSRDEVLAEWDLLRGEGCTRAQAAERMGMSLAALERALFRARSAGETVRLGQRRA